MNVLLCAMALAANLDNPSYDARQKASESLQQYHVSFILALTPTSDNMQCYLCEIKDAILSKQLQQLGDMPFIDSLWWDSEKKNYNATGMYFGHEVAKLKTYIDFSEPATERFSVYKSATKKWVIDMLLSDRHNLDDIKKLLHYMRQNDKMYLSTLTPTEITL